MKILSDYILFDKYDESYSSQVVLPNFVNIVDKFGKHYFPCIDMAFEYAKSYIFKDIDSGNRIEESIDTSYMTSAHVTQLNKIYKYGHGVKEFDEHVWNKIKFQLMYELEMQRYFYNREHMDELFRFADKKIVFCGASNDTWGCGYNVNQAMNFKDNWNCNHLGHVLEKVQKDIVAGVTTTPYTHLDIFINKEYIDTSVDNGQLNIEF